MALKLWAGARVLQGGAIPVRRSAEIELLLTYLRQSKSQLGYLEKEGQYEAFLHRAHSVGAQ